MCSDKEIAMQNRLREYLSRANTKQPSVFLLVICAILCIINLFYYVLLVVPTPMIRCWKKSKPCRTSSEHI